MSLAIPWTGNGCLKLFLCARASFVRHFSAVEMQHFQPVTNNLIINSAWSRPPSIPADNCDVRTTDKMIPDFEFLSVPNIGLWKVSTVKN